MFIHTRSNDVDYESVQLHDDTSTISVWLEFIGVPVSVYDQEPSSAQPTESWLPVCEELQSSVQATSTNTYNLKFLLPVHFRYQPPIECGGDRSTAFVTETLNSPQVFARTSNNTPRDFAAVAGQGRPVHWLYNQTKLGRTGNYATYNTLYRHFQSYQLVDSGETASGVAFSISTGCTEDLDSVVFMSGLTLVLTTAVVLLFVCAKLWR